MRSNQDRTAKTLGLLIFLFGVALLSYTFWLAFTNLQTPPDRALGIKPGEAIDLNNVGKSFLHIILRMLMLLIMCIVSSVIASRGLKLLITSRTSPSEPEEDKKA